MNKYQNRKNLMKVMIKKKIKTKQKESINEEKN